MIVLQEIDNKRKARQHQYPISVVFFVITLIQGAIAFRAVARIFIAMRDCKIPIFEHFNFQPSWKSSELWFLRYGLYKLTRTKENAIDWIIILDFKVQAGCQKCLIVLGVRLSTLVSQFETRGSFDVHHEDFEPLAVQTMSSSSGEKVAEVLEEISERTGPFLQVLADHGGDVNKGVRIYCKAHEGTVNTYDIVHKVAILLKNQLEKDDVWTIVIKLITDTKQRTKQSPEACLSPPKQREKARFMNADILIDWLQEILNFLQTEEEVSYLDRSRLIDKLGWVLRFENVIEEYGQMIEVIRLVRHQIRTEGLHRRSHAVFFRNSRGKFKDLKTRSFDLAKEIFLFLKQEGAQVPAGQILLGSSEGIESIIGREKVIVERTNATNSITKSVLAIAAMAGKNSDAVVKEALETVSVSALEDWEDKWIGKSDLAKRRELFNLMESEPLPLLRVGNS